ncbi:hypothetical protein JG688_00011497 [Phytophthora aleatoria]|uniref:Uncharacterized protein n=1 Tax=Phytophthora aleatoria TaxID=2496075 RepID=A0A8J5MEQ2_9STRA|nr:hypothetical protein JG688_00011497 [Phytophthora aleatoria]
MTLALMTTKTSTGLEILPKKMKCKKVGMCADVMTDKEDDLNCTVPDEDATQYSAMDCGDEAALGDIGTGEEGDIIPDVLDVDDDTYAPDATELEIAQEIRFAEYFLENIGGDQSVLAGNLQDKVLRERSVNGWEGIEK